MRSSSPHDGSRPTPSCCSSPPATIRRRPFAAPGLPELRPDALGPQDARALVAERLGPQVSAEVVDWLITSANGNPLALVELPATLTAGQLAGRERFEGELRPPTTVEQAYLARVDRLPLPARSMLVVAACEETGERAAVVRAADGLGLDADALSVAEEQGLIRVGRDRIEFCHPLVRAAVYRGAGFAERERAHRALAESAADADRGAWHRAAATVGTDEEVAEELESTAERARLRGGHAGSAAALERAAELTADPEARGRRLTLAARAAWHAGQAERATTLLDWASPIVADPRLRAELDHVRGEIQFRCGSLREAALILVAGAADVAPYDPRKACEMLLEAGSATAKAGDADHLAEIGRRVAQLPRSGNELESLRIDLVIGVED